MKAHKVPAKILVVDDEASMRELLVIMLQREGYQVDQANNGLTALEKTVADSFDLIISDIQMPKMTGIERLSLSSPIQAEA